jgi:hypothetical protein
MARNIMFQEKTASNLKKFEFYGTPLQVGPRKVSDGLFIHAGD